MGNAGQKSIPFRGASSIANFPRPVLVAIKIGGFELPNTFKGRAAVYKAIEKDRKSRVIALVTGDRPGMQAQIAGDAVDLLTEHLDAIFPLRKYR
jgi:hypothetical protein